MSAQVVVNKEGKKPQYKEYVSFLRQYKNKDDQGTLDDSSTLKKGFKDYLENYNSKKYSPVQPPFIQKPREDKKLVKTEVFVEINNTPNTVSKVCKVFEIPNQNNGFVKSADVPDANLAVENKVNMFKIESNGTAEQKKVSIGEISKKFEENQSKANAIHAEPIKPPLKKKSSISKMTKVFEESSNKSQNEKKEADVRKNIFNEAAQMFKQNNINSSTKSTASISPKPTVNSITMTIPPPPPPIFRSPPKSPSPPLLQSPPQIKVIPPSKSSSPAPPETNTPPPPPPPMPPSNFTPKKSTSPVRVESMRKPQTNGYNTLPKMHTPPQAHPTNDKEAPKLDRNDPMVKKLVYNALRGMVVGYHDKANDYLATLPKNRVKKNNGLDSIINSLGNQGGLDKLTGRGKTSTVDNE